MSATKDIIFSGGGGFWETLLGVADAKRCLDESDRILQRATYRVADLKRTVASLEAENAALRERVMKGRWA